MSKLQIEGESNIRVSIYKYALQKKDWNWLIFRCTRKIAVSWTFYQAYLKGDLTFLLIYRVPLFYHYFEPVVFLICDNVYIPTFGDIDCLGYPVASQMRGYV